MDMEEITTTKRMRKTKTPLSHLVYEMISSVTRQLFSSSTNILWENPKN